MFHQVQMMSGHQDPKTVMRYDHGRENLDQNTVDFSITRTELQESPPHARQLADSRRS